MSDGHKDDSGGADDRFAQLGQQAGAVLGQLFAAAEQFGQQVNRESQTWSESGRHDPFVSALRQAGEEFRATANRAAENLSDSFRQSQDSPDAGTPETGAADAAGAAGAKGNVRKIGGGPLQSASVDSTSTANTATAPKDKSGTGAGNDADKQKHTQRVAQLAEVFATDDSLASLSADEFDALKELLGSQYRAIREFQNR
jgi:hypothetical protein